MVAGRVAGCVTLVSRDFTLAREGGHPAHPSNQRDEQCHSQQVLLGLLGLAVEPEGEAGEEVGHGRSEQIGAV